MADRDDWVPMNINEVKPFPKLDKIEVDPLSDDTEDFIMNLRYRHGNRRFAVGQTPDKLISCKENPDEKKEGYTRFVVISDTHGNHEELTTNPAVMLPPGDILLHCGDFTQLGKEEEVDDFNTWLEKLPYKHKIVIAGNHELSFDPRVMSKAREAERTGGYDKFKFLGKIPEEVTNSWPKRLSNCVFINDAEVIVDGIRIYGCSWNPWFGGWAYNVQRGQELLDKWNKIPSGIDILMTHSPPAGHRDRVRKEDRYDYDGRGGRGGRSRGWNYDGSPSEKVGCVELLNTVQLRVQPKYHLFGHIHESYGVDTDGNIIYANCSTIDYLQNPVNKPIVIDLPNPPDSKEGIEVIQH